MQFLSPIMSKFSLPAALIRLNLIVLLSLLMIEKTNLFYILVYPVSQCKVRSWSLLQIYHIRNLPCALWNWKLWALLASNQRLKIKRVLRSMFRRRSWYDLCDTTAFTRKKICDTTGSVHDSGQRNISMCPLPAPHLSDPLPEVFIMAFTDVHPRRARKLIPRTALVAAASNFHNC